MLKGILKLLAPEIEYTVYLKDVNLPLEMQVPRELYSSPNGDIDILKNYLEYEVVGIEKN